METEGIVDFTQMSPWSIVGWVAVGGAAVVVVAVLTVFTMCVMDTLSGWLRDRLWSWYMWRTTRSTQPEVGQTWVSGRGVWVRVSAIRGGEVTIDAGSYLTMNIPLDKWQAYVDEKRLYLRVTR